ncbi:MAG: hypothetical protein JNM68_05300 [Dinghuibacter sp.]|nr:hypothetical protein [Dinghuibacter sp.]
MPALLQLTPTAFAAELEKAQATTGWLINTPNGFTGANDLLRNLAAEVAAMPDFSNHEAVFFRYDAETQCLYFAFVHNTVRGQAQGGTRLKHKGYEQVGELIKDGLRLSRGMTEKNSVAGLWWGGGKAIICPLTPEVFAEIDRHVIANRHKEYTNLPLRKKLFTNYGTFIAGLNGIYIAAEDMNTTPTDMLHILSVCRYVTCLPPEAGGGSNPSSWTAAGVFQAMLATVKFFENRDDLSGKTVSIQGLGNVGFALAEMALNSGARLLVYDYDPGVYELLAPFGNRVETVSAEEIYTRPTDIFAPCAIGGILNPGTIPQLSCRFVVGAANNQLATAGTDYRLLAERGIVYLPDFFINRMGIVNCANEQYGRLENDLLNEVKHIYTHTLQLLEACAKTGKTPQETALEWANTQSRIPHPIWGHRGAQLAADHIVRHGGQ